MKRRQALLAGMGLLSGAVAAEDLRILYPQHESLQGPQVGYVLALLRLALERCERRYRLQASERPMVQSRSLIELARPEPGIDLFWTMTTAERERRLLPIRIPLERGLIGWRLALVRAGDRERFAALQDLADLAPHVAGQLHDWPDTAILRANGLRVRAHSHFQSLFSQLAEGVVDYLPRSIIEIDGEVQAYADRGLAIEPHLLLRYPTALYFFVSPRRPQLHADLSQGLEAAQADGSFERAFQQQFGALAARHRLAQRRQLQLANPALPAATPLQRKELWFQLPL
ncbi:hypothetical protein OOZ63_00550 [Paucibacter sp. PLA-PC-4]|uniref:hypothetical protein n=1 Tax=Paucibacter sp. PLA-PC-4 TaxID=2993655 RepID=UPI0022487F66|nr:hypothetical protein [Paucibacter sp. PLA-PC-4]MCX2860327.1 hypothetical protein [Paucibacter sp. PLA-PC-4]